MREMEAAHYKLRCVSCGRTYEDDGDGFFLACAAKHPASLLRSEYVESTLALREDAVGVLRFSQWLPRKREIADSPLPAVYHSTGLGRALGLDNLHIVFNGYWPEKGAFMETCTFKELEAPGVCGRIDRGSSSRLVVSSAGNTARAFLKVCSENDIDLVVVVPEEGIPCLWSCGEIGESVQVVAVTGGADYFDAIEVGNALSGLEGYFPEGGAKNVGRRDGMGIAFLAAVVSIGELPDHYFQAVGSGTGGIAAWEAAERLLKDGGYGPTRVKLHLAQNSPFTIMTDAWNEGSRSLPEVDEAEAKKRIESVHAHVLSNRRPPYSVAGGVYDVLSESGGHMYSVTNREAQRFGLLFNREEGCDLDPAAEVAVAALAQAVQMGRVRRGDRVVLNITGGGYRRLRTDKQIRYRDPDLTVDIRDFHPQTVAEKLASLKSLTYA